MSRALLKICLAAAASLISVVLAYSQADTTRLETLLDEYIASMEMESASFKSAECDFILETCSDSLLRNRVARRLYSHYSDSDIMGDEAVAIHLYDSWFATSRAVMETEAALLEASVYATFNRASQIGCPAPELSLRTPGGGNASFPRPGRTTVLYFYDLGCSKCNMTGILLKYLLEEHPFDADLVAVYTGTDEPGWKEYIGGAFDVAASSVNVFHVWDPGLESDFQRKYGIMSTPGLFLLNPDGVIAGRRLDVEALGKLLSLSAVEKELDGLCPIGSRLPKIKINGRNIRKYDYLVFHTEGCSRCAKELAAMETAVPGRKKVLKIDVDEVLSSDRELAGVLFSQFDLSVLPFILREDRRGRVVEKYISFVRQ